MTVVRLKGLKRFKDRHGKWRTYHRATGLPIHAELGTPAFLAEFASLESKIKPRPAARPGTLHGLISVYRQSDAFLGLARETRRDYERVFEFLKPFGELRLAELTSPHIASLRDKAKAKHQWRFANHVRATLSTMCSRGIELGLLDRNPCTGVRSVPRPKALPPANRPWTDVEREIIMDALPAHMRPPMALMMYAGLGPKDALTLPRTAYKDGAIEHRRSKTGVRISFPLSATARQLISDAGHHDAITLCATKSGRPWTVDGFSASFRKIKDKLESEGQIGAGLTLYGLRHTVAVILREMGHSDRTIADMLGQTEPRMALHYAKGADLRKNNAATAASLETEMNARRTKLVKPETENCQTPRSCTRKKRNV